MTSTALLVMATGTNAQDLLALSQDLLTAASFYGAARPMAGTKPDASYRSAELRHRLISQAADLLATREVVLLGSPNEAVALARS